MVRGSEGISTNPTRAKLSRSTKYRYFVFGFYFVDKYEGNMHLKVFMKYGQVCLTKCCK